MNILKHFIYLDTDTLNSYLSQINDGLLKAALNESVDEIRREESENNIPGGTKMATDIGLKPIFNMKFADEKDTIETTKTLSQIETGRELIEKILHDNAFDQLNKYLTSRGLIVGYEECEVGKYISDEESKFITRDLDYIINIYTDEFIDFMIENRSREKIKQAKEVDYDIIKEEIKKEEERTRRIFRIAKNILPYSKFIITNKFIIPITDKYLRESFKAIKFSYSSRLKILGKYEGVLSEAFKKEDGLDTFSGMLLSIDDFLKTFFINILRLEEDIKILIPIALYFE